MKPLIIGWGNPLASGDGVGPRTAQLVAGRVEGDADVIACSASPLRLVEAMRGYTRVIVADVCPGPQNETIRRHVVRPNELPVSSGLNRHDGTLAEALQTFRALGDSDLPDEILLLSAPVSLPGKWGSGLTVEEERTAAQLAEAVWSELEVTAVA
jgi:hydrogenase maturation protease